jgi:hypothetical protein
MSGKRGRVVGYEHLRSLARKPWSMSRRQKPPTPPNHRPRCCSSASPKCGGLASCSRRGDQLLRLDAVGYRSDTRALGRPREPGNARSATSRRKSHGVHNSSGARTKSSPKMVTFLHAGYFLALTHSSRGGRVADRSWNCVAFPDLGVCPPDLEVCPPDLEVGTRFISGSSFRRTGLLVVVYPLAQKS